MKKGIFACLVASFVIGNPLPFSIRQPYDAGQSFISGKVSPLEGVESVCAVSVQDSVWSAAAQGNFTIQVDPGKYRLIVNTKLPYRKVALGNLEVRRNQALNIGEIILQK